MNQLIELWREIVHYLKDDTTSNHATIIIAIASVLNLFTAILLWRANRKTAKITQLIFRNQSKPIISISQKVHIDRRPTNRLTWYYLITTIENQGNLEAEIILFDFQIQHGIDETCWHLTDNFFPLTLAPGKSRELSIPLGPDFVEKLKRFNHYRIDIRYHGVTKQYYCYSEYRNYDVERDAFGTVWNKNVEYNYFKTRYYRAGERFPKFFRYVEQKRRTYGSEEKRIIKPQQSQESDQEHGEPTPPQNPS
jgi:hypothetical protein